MSTIPAGSQSAFMKVLKGETQTRPPVWLMRQAGRYLPEYRELRAKAGSFLDLCYTPDFAVEVTLQPIRRFGFDAAILFSDILVVPDALGQDVAFKQGEGPVLEPVRDMAALKRLGKEGLLERLAPVLETVGRLRAELPPETALIGFAGAPWTVATYMVEGKGSKDQALTRRRAFEAEDGFFPALIDLLTDATADYLIAQADAGVNALQIFDSWSGSLAASQFERWVASPVREIVARVRQRHPGLPIIGFPKGAGAQLLRYPDLTGVTALGLDYSIDPLWAAAAMAPDLPLQGNLDPMALVAGGAALERETRRILSAFKERPHIFNLGHGIVPETPIAHVENLLELVRGEKGRTA